MSLPHPTLSLMSTIFYLFGRHVNIILTHLQMSKYIFEIFFSTLKITVRTKSPAFQVLVPYLVQIMSPISYKTPLTLHFIQTPSPSTILTYFFMSPIYICFIFFLPVVKRVTNFSTADFIHPPPYQFCFIT